MRNLLRYLVLPKEISTFERAYLARTNRLALIFFALHVPVMVILAGANRTRPLFALALSLAICAGPFLAQRTLSSPRSVSLTLGVAAMFMGGALVHFGQGPVQIEMHFYFFALIAMLAVFGNPLVVLAAAVTVALHHLVLWFVIPSSVFNYDAPMWVVAVHAAFVVLESVAACFIARSFFDNVIGLERIVSDRTAQLDARNRDLRLVLDNVAQGFLTIDRAAIASAERSRVLDRWLGPTTATAETLFDLFERKSPDFATMSRVAWEEVRDGSMPLEVTLGQMPRELSVDAERLRVVYLPIGDGPAPDRFLVVVTDVTAEVSRERAERDRREATQLFEQFLRDRRAVHDFFEDGAAMVDKLTTGALDDTAARRALHTLKGNSAIYGFQSLSDVCHTIETESGERGAPPSPAELAMLRDRWEALAHIAERLLGASGGIIEVDASEHARLEESVRQGPASRALLRQVHGLKLEHTHRRLEHFAERAQRIAKRLGKDVSVQVEGGDLRVDPKYWAPIWSAFVHAVRNALDHGFERAEFRKSQGKPGRGTLTMRMYSAARQLVLEIADDGKGIDWSSVARSAERLGLPARNESDLVEALFSDGVTTSPTVTEISGRGVGMGALRAATTALGGRVEIETAPNRGTTIRMIFPSHAATPDLGEDVELPHLAA